MVSQILEHPNINVSLNTQFLRAQKEHITHVFYSGPLDGYLDHEFGPLGCRTLDFDQESFEILLAGKPDKIWKIGRYPSRSFGRRPTSAVQARVQTSFPSQHSQSRQCISPSRCVARGRNSSASTVP
ncbi:UDP-galactopyranose mutase (plasmid) [Rhizobium sp. T1473]|uniref:UDP-galactopyranose mutase n=1 Tax=Rhizobium sp. T1473 TaxID=555321 RepID=UPI0030D5EB56